MVEPPLQPIAAPYPIHAGSQMPVIPPQLSERYTEHSAPFSASSGFASNRNHEPVRPFQRGRATPGPPRTAGLPAFTSSSNPLRPTSASESDDSDSDLDVNPMLRPVPTSSRGAFRPTYSGHRTPLRNPLPSLPRNVYDSSPYKGLLTFPKTTELLNSTYGSATLDPSQAPNHTEKEGKKSKKGLFRSFSASRKKDKPDRPSITVVPVVVPQPQAMAPPTAMPVPEPAPPLTPGGNPPSVKFDHKGPLSGFMNHSPHRVMYQNETYPSALHLYEALKFIGHRPDLAEKIRKCGRVHDVYPLSASLQDHVRPDWGQVYLKMVRYSRSFTRPTLIH
jgi:hypothetical protein